MKCEVCGLDEIVLIPGESITVEEGHELCDSCISDVIRCAHCRKLLGVTMDDLTVGPMGELDIPEVILPGKQVPLLFCNIAHMQEYVKTLKEDDNAG